MTRGPLPEFTGDRSLWPFGQLLQWHLNWGTRPGERPEKLIGSKQWTIEEISERLDCDARNVRNWIKGKKPLQKYYDIIELLFFGDDKEGALLNWRAELRRAYLRAGGGGEGDREAEISLSLPHPERQGGESPSGLAVENKTADVSDGGDGGEDQKHEVIELYKVAANRGHVDAMVRLGLAYHRGHGVEKNEREGVDWYRKAAAQGHAAAQTYLGWALAYGVGVKQNELEGMAWFRKSAEQNVADAQKFIGLMLANGHGVIEKNEPEAVEWYRKAAEQNNPGAPRLLADMYANGRGVEKDEQEAEKWYRKAVEQGDPEAPLVLASLLLSRRDPGTKSKHDKRGNERADQALPEWQQITSWMEIKGRWGLESDGKAIYLGPDNVSGPFGICVSDCVFSEGEIKITITLTQTNKIAARIVFGYSSPAHQYFGIGLGGNGGAYTLTHFIPEKGGWDNPRSEGQEDRLAIGRPYLLHVEVSGKRIALKSKGMPVLQYTHSEPIQPGHIALLAYGDGGTVEFTDVAVKKAQSP